MSEPTEVKTVKYFVLASGGYLQEPKLDVVELSTEDDDFDPEEESFDEYVKYHVGEARAEYEQGFSQTFVIEEKDLPLFASMINVEVVKLGRR